jgi:hypothetical protein
MTTNNTVDVKGSKLMVVKTGYEKFRAGNSNALNAG